MPGGRLAQGIRFRATEAVAGLIFMVLAASAQPREPAVPGSFYPKDPATLSAMIRGFLDAVKPLETCRVRALVCPHAGYAYSGPVAAASYKAVEGADFRTVIVLAPSHFASFEGGAIAPTDYRTPLGTVRLSPVARELAQVAPFSADPKAAVERPQWAAGVQSVLKERPDTWEHSLEVQLPFLQTVLKDFSLVPVVCGRMDPAAAARAIAPRLDAQTLIVASSDLSHYHPYEAAKQLDGGCVTAICNLDVKSVERAEACGKGPILTVMHLAKQFGWKPKLLDYRNSGDTAGDRRGVVGYAAIAFCESETSSVRTRGRSEEGGGDRDASRDDGTTAGGTGGREFVQETSMTLTHDEGQALVRLARSAVNEAVTHGRQPRVDEATLPAKFREPKGCFVTLTKQGQLRGCIGNIFPRELLWRAILETANSAALCDPRFSPVTVGELKDIEVEVSVLTPPEALKFEGPEDLLAKLQPHRDGVVLRIGANMATFLPQVWEQLGDKTEFLSHLCRKAGCTSDAWRGKGVEVQIYHVQAFKESEF